MLGGGMFGGGLLGMLDDMDRGGGMGMGGVGGGSFCSMSSFSSSSMGDGPHMVQYSSSTTVMTAPASEW